MKIVAFLQNQWFKNPALMQRILLEQFKGDREKFVATYLFYGCVTGQRLRAALGEDLCDQIVWENASPVIGGEASAKFVADRSHVKRVIEKHEPTHVIGFGKVACDILDEIRTIHQSLHSENVPWKFIRAPHPAARQSDVPMRLKLVAETLLEYAAE